MDILKTAAGAAVFMMAVSAHANACTPGLVGENPQRAVEVCQKALKKTPDDPQLQFLTGSAYFHSGDHKKGFEWRAKAAHQGHAQAQHHVAAAYHTGMGVKQDYQKAFEWYAKSANQGNLHAQHELGNLYYAGLGVKQDYAQAARWYTPVAESGNVYAQRRLAEMYRKGLGVKKDLKTAKQWYAEACQNGDEEACKSAGNK